MANLEFKVCPKCRRLKPVGNGDRLCSDCKARQQAERPRERDYKREYELRKESEDPKYRSFYRSKDWQMTSRAYAQSVGHRCEVCGRIGTDVHHIEPIQTDGGWERRFDFGNLRLLCVKCHNKAHGRTFGNDWGRK